jgi:hypothetical protein
LGFCAIGRRSTGEIAPFLAASPDAAGSVPIPGLRTPPARLQRSTNHANILARPEGRDSDWTRTMPEFAPEDVRRIAAALVKTAIETTSEEDGGARNQCKICNASVPWLQTGDEIKHEPDCAVAVAQKILARSHLHSV